MTKADIQKRWNVLFYHNTGKITDCDHYDKDTVVKVSFKSKFDKKQYELVIDRDKKFVFFRRWFYSLNPHKLENLKYFFGYASSPFFSLDSITGELREEQCPQIYQ